MVTMKAPQDFRVIADRVIKRKSLKDLKETVKIIRGNSAARGTDNMTMDEINAIIKGQ